MSNELYTFAEPVQVVPFSSLKWGKFTLLHTVNKKCARSKTGAKLAFIYNKAIERIRISLLQTTHMPSLPYSMHVCPLQSKHRSQE